MVMIAEKLRVLWHDLIGGWKSTPCSLHTVLQAAENRVKATKLIYIMPKVLTAFT